MYWTISFIVTLIQLAIIVCVTLLHYSDIMEFLKDFPSIYYKSPGSWNDKDRRLLYYLYLCLISLILSLVLWPIIISIYLGIFLWHWLKDSDKYKRIIEIIKE